MRFENRRQIYGGQLSLFNDDPPLNHERIHAPRLAEQQRADRISCAGIADFVKRKDRRIRRFADFKAADVVAPQTGRAAERRHAQRVHDGHAVRAARQPRQ